MVKNGSQVQHMGDRDLDMGERRCKGALVGKSVGMRNCRREEVRGGKEKKPVAKSGRRKTYVSYIVLRRSP